MGFEGANPCGQTHGVEKLYPSGQTPTEILLSGNYTKVKNYVIFFIPLECRFLTNVDMIPIKNFNVLLLLFT